MLSPNPLGPDEGIYSGNAFIDKKGRVAVHYHGIANGKRAGNCIAINDEDDGLDSLVKLSANPVMPGWDPFGWLEDDVYYSISGTVPPAPGSGALLYKSVDEDQIDWELVGPLLTHELPDVGPDEDISCPDFFQLGDKRVLLCVSHNRGARYYLGRFEDEQFHPEQHLRMNWPGGACFAPETLLDGRGRRLFWAWAIGSPTSLTLPRVLSMDEDGRLNIEPAEEIDSLRRNHKKVEDITVAPGADADLGEIRGDRLELRVRITQQRAMQYGIKVRSSPDGCEETAIEVDSRHSVLRIDVSNTSLDKGTLPTSFVAPRGPGPNPVVTCQEAPFELGPDEPLELRIYLDGSMLEVFGNGRQCLTQRIFPTRDDSTGVRLYSVGSATKVDSVEAWEMGGISVH